MNIEGYIKEIINSLALLSRKIEMLNSVNFYDINISAEDFYAKLFNLIFGYSLKNLNTVEKNAPAIDLCDDERRISIQVTSDNTSDKIKKTISKFIEHEHYKKYDRLIILILTKKKNYRTDFDTQKKFVFNAKRDVLDYNDLVKTLREKEISELNEIRSFLKLYISSEASEKIKTQASEVETIIDLIEYITQNRKVTPKRNSVVDPQYKIYKRFKEFTERIVSEYTRCYIIYGNALETVNSTIDIDEAQELITMMYLQDISINYLDENDNDPVKALNKLVEYFEDKLSKNGKHYDRAAIKFYLLNEMIKCNIFPNEGSE